MMTETELTADDLSELETGDELTVEYESVQGEHGNTQSFTATVYEVDARTTQGHLFGTISLKRDADDISRRRIKISAGSLTVQGRRTTINGAVWAKMSRATTVTVTVETEDADVESEGGEVECSRCNGTGEQGPDIVNPDPCSSCDGNGTVPAGDARDADGNVVSEGDSVTVRNGSLIERVETVHSDGLVTLSDGRSMPSDHLHVDGEGDESGNSDGGEPTTDGGREVRADGGEPASEVPREDIRADISHQTDRNGNQIGSRLAESSPELAALAREVQKGDTVDVEYYANGLETNAAGVVSSVAGQDTNRNSVDIRFGDGCYLHVNADTGDYYFQDRGREQPDNGREVRAITVRARGGN